MTDNQSLHDYESISESVFASSSSDCSDLEKAEEDLNLLEEFGEPTKPLLDYRSGTKAEPVSQSTVAYPHNQLTVQERIAIQQKQLGEITSTLARLMQKSEIDRARSESSLPPIDWPDFQEYQAVQEKALPGPPPVRLAAPDYEEIAYASEPDLPSLADIARSTSTRSSTFKSPARDPGTSPELPFSRRASTFKPPVDLPQRCPLPVLGTLTNEVRQLDIKYFDSEERIREVATKLRLEREARGEESGMYAY